MSVLIKGMKMPKNCGQCFLRGAGCKNRIYEAMRPAACPLVELPPHGRLKDADELRKAIKSLPNCYNGFSDTYDKACIIGLIDEQPTIIEAEEESNG